ncbi:DUF11 domain-containing protein [Streptomyces sp. NPDC051183]|uniref:DUF11 domain-containing protein n=1 Tax=Streptomyces sp. NPDC051183 TaxID=3155165 RepID=UPI003448768A
MTAFSAVAAACWCLPLAPAVASAPGDSGATPSAIPSATATASASASASASVAAAPEPEGDPESADLAVSGVLAREVREARESTAAAARETFDYVVTVTNRGPSTARQVRVTDRLPASLEFVASPDGCTASGRTAVCGPLDTLAAGASHAWVITVRLSADYRGDGADIVNEAVVDAATKDPDSRNNKASTTGLKIPPSARTADLSLRKRALLARGREHVWPGEKFTYLITVRNQGPATARQVQVTDRLPASLALLSSPDDCEVPEGGGRLVVCPPRERLASGATAQFRITVRVVAGERARPPAQPCTPIENVARVTSASFDPDLSDNANAPDTTGPDGGRLCLAPDGGEDHHGGPADHGREDHHGKDGQGGREDHHGDPQQHHGDPHHDGRGDLADSGTTVPGWLVWASAALVAGGALLRRVFRARA